jgi:hypothetical protein
MRDYASFSDVYLVSTKVGNDMEMETSTFTGWIDADSLNVTGNLLMGPHATFNRNVSLRSADIGGYLYLGNSSFAASLTLNSIHARGALFMKDGATFAENVDLVGANIDQNIELDKSSFAGPVIANSAHTKGSLFMHGGTFTADVNLVGAEIDGNLELSRSTFSGTLEASYIGVKGTAFLDGAHFDRVVDLSSARLGNLFSEGASFGAKLDLGGARVGGYLDLWGTAGSQVDLSSIEARQLFLGEMKWRCSGAPSQWPLGAEPRPSSRCEVPPTFTLRNARAETFQDTEDAWPPSLDLEGFRYSELGTGGGGTRNMRDRTADKWIDWLARDPELSTEPYQQLGSVLSAAGKADAADAIRLAGRERERDDAHGWHWFWLSALYYLSGYGIGLYLFLHVMWWVAFLTLLGAVLLHYSANARRRGVPWRVGASLNRLLPVIELSKEFTEFFDNGPPDFDEEPNLNGWLAIYFAAHAVFGWVLGIFLLAAIGGLIQK